MTLSTGTKLSHYKITSQLGKGGMGVVYQATDTKLERDVAIKVLPEEFAQDAERVARFQREAKLLASLNHPNIAAIHGLEEVDGTNFLVMELVEGNTLDDRIKSGAIPVEEALKLALQIAEALEAAHEKGVIHRDLKPANIKVTPDGKVKVLDFGLAKAFAGEQADLNLSNSPTLSDMATQQGVILGTAAYMSPEQARGKEVDKRVDVWAFGVVLFEMLTARSLFSGEDVSSTLARVLEREPDFSALPHNLHPRIKLLLERCLKKEPKNRYGVISDARVDIQEVIADPGGVLVKPVTSDTPQKKLRTILPWVGAAIIVAGMVGWLLKTSPPPEPRQVARLEYQIPESQQFTNQLSISPDGGKFVYTTKEGLYLRYMNSLDARLINGTDKDSRQPFFSPDGKWIGFWASSEQKLKKVAISGGASIVLCDTAEQVFGASWYPEDTIVYSELPSGIMRVPSKKGGTPETLIKANLIKIAKEGFPTAPQILPDGKTLLFTNAFDASDPTKNNIEIQSLESEERNVLVRGGTGGRYLPSGHIVYALVNNGINNLFAVPFDIDKLKVTGEPVSILENFGNCAVSDSGTLVYVPPRATAAGSANIVGPQRTLIWVDRKGNEESLGADPVAYIDAKIAPDGTRAALTVSKDGNMDIWVFDFDHKTPTRLTRHEAEDTFPLWTPDSQRILFHSLREGVSGVYAIAANGTGGIEKLGTAADRAIGPSSWSDDGNTLVLAEVSLASLSYNIGIMSMEGDHERKPLLNQKYNEAEPQISPDGRWMAYKSDESGEWEIYIVSFPNIDEYRQKISTDGGISPRWSTDGRELFYIKDNYVMVAAVKTEPSFKFENPKVLFEGDFVTWLSGRSDLSAPWDIHPDGQRFLMIKPPPTTATESTEEEPAPTQQPKIIVVLNWFEELKQRVPVD